MAQPASSHRTPAAQTRRRCAPRMAHSPTRITSASRSAARRRACRRLSSARSVIGPMRTRYQTSSSTATRCTFASMPCSLSCARDAIRLFLLAIRAGLQYVDAGPFDGDRRVVALARDFAILLRHHHFEVRQHVVEVVVLRAVLDVAGGRAPCPVAVPAAGPRWLRAAASLLAVVLPDQHAQRQAQAERQAERRIRASGRRRSACRRCGCA